MAPKATKSFPNPALPSDKVPDSNLPDSRPFADYTERGTILVISQPAGQSCAVVGGIMATRIKHLGAKGLVVDGRVRDVVALNDTQLPIWSRGTSVIGAGAETKLHARNVPIRVGETIVEPGDIVMIDPFENGVVAVPQAKVDELLELLPKLVGADERVLADVEQGVSVQEAFKRHRTLTMGITDFFTDVWETFAQPSPDAEAPQGGSSTKTPASGTDEESSDEAEVNKKDQSKGGSQEQGHKPSGGDDADEEPEEEEEEEEEPDPKEQLEKECAESKECHGPKHHYDECVERVTGQIENDGKASEDCVEEFFHLAHCATQCAAPKLFAQLK
ncbi:RraA-like protein [Cucurbitaria berberidis CBS 394.84]|uniref:Cytochrome b-c1 complex subunit 6, mitochondrial n=1 Tax=Cucurbitaria berberidis CBS 394.84 TaxID=1168544 RepID=A0A9P4GH24_9PLEO|nr:RraA-like protein [Cucurbitaria berberidis CBS 394.84]KAF1845324.1 RraA-like protein [Cucurbitaria berberidis CBS 394.84]